MSNPTRPFLCFKTAHPALALDYWDGEYNAGKWGWALSVEAVAQRHQVKKTEVPAFAAQTAVAVDTARRCGDCLVPQVLTSRSAFSTPRPDGYVCSDCADRKKLAVAQKRYQEENDRQLSRRKHIEELAARNRSYKYSDISYANAILVFGIMLASDDACELGRFSDTAGLHLCPTTALSGKVLGGLFDAGILRISETTHPESVLRNEDGSWSYYPHRVNWEFAADAEGRSFPAVMSLMGAIVDLRDEDPGYSQAVSDLWWKLGYDDAVRHLEDEAEAYSLPDIRMGPKTKEAIQHALTFLSIPQVRREITRVIKNAAALSNHRDFSRRHALNTFPGTLISFVDRAVSEGWQIWPLLRNWQNEEPVLTTVLFNRVLGKGLPGFRVITGQELQSDLLTVEGAR